MDVNACAGCAIASIMASAAQAVRSGPWCPRQHCLGTMIVYPGLRLQQSELSHEASCITEGSGRWQRAPMALGSHKCASERLQQGGRVPGGPVK